MIVLPSFLPPGSLLACVITVRANVFGCLLTSQVSSDEKGRMTIISEEGSGLLIRANQGHSLKGLVDEEQLLLRVNAATDIPICVHGTFLRHWPRSGRKETI